jgi:hypothetical protein
MGILLPIIQLAILVAALAGLWKTFEKAGRPGWEGIVPFYNIWILATVIVGKPPLWFIIGLIPFVNILLHIEVAKQFGKTTGYGVGLGLLPFVFYPMLGFSDAKFTPPTAPPPAA